MASNASLWLDATDINGDGSAVTAGTLGTWVNKGTAGAALNATQSAAANAPSLVTNAINGQPALLFTGSNHQYLAITSTAMGTLQGNAHTIFIVALTNTGGQADGLGSTYQAIAISPGYHNGFRFMGSDSTTAIGFDQWTNSGGNGHTYYLNSQNSYSQGSVAVMDGVVSGSTTAGPSSLMTYLNGAGPTSNSLGTQPYPTFVSSPATTGNSLAFDNINTLNLACGFTNASADAAYLTGDIAEVLVFNTAMSDADRQTVENYLRYKWEGVGSPPPTGLLPSGGDVTIGATGTLDVGLANQTIGMLSGVSGSKITLGGGSLTTVVSGSAACIFAGSISGNGAFIKSGDGMLTLSGTNTHTATTVSSGTLSVAFDANLGTGGVTLADGTLELTGSAFSSGKALTLGTGGGTVQVDAFAALSGTISGSGGLTKTGNGLLTVQPGNTYAGATIIRGGTLRMMPVMAPAIVQSAAVWLDPSQSATLATSGSTVTGWANLGTSGGIATSTSGHYAGIPPTLTSNVFGNLPGVYFQANSNAGTQLTLSNFFTNGSNTISEFVVAKQTTSSQTSTTEMSLLDISNSGNATTSNVDYKTPALLLEGNIYTVSGGVSSNKIGARNDTYGVTVSEPGQGTPMVLDTVYNGQTGSVDVVTSNGGTQTTVSGSGTYTGAITGSLYLGREYYNNTAWPGDVGEVLVFNTALSANDRQAVENYLYNKWILGQNFVAPNVLPAATAVAVAGGATLDLNGAVQQVASLSDYAVGNCGSVINSNTAAAAILTLSPTGGSTTFSGLIAGGGTNGTIGLVMSGTGTQVLAGSNSYTGGTNLNAGMLVAANSAGSALGTGTVALGGGTLAAGPAGGTITGPGASGQQPAHHRSGGRPDQRIRHLEPGRRAEHQQPHHAGLQPRRAGICRRYDPDRRRRPEHRRQHGYQLCRRSRHAGRLSPDRRRHWQSRDQQLPAAHRAGKRHLLAQHGSRCGLHRPGSGLQRGPQRRDLEPQWRLDELGQ